MKKYLKTLAVLGLSMFIAGEVSAATTWNISTWGKRRAFTEHLHKLSELIEQRSGGEWKMNISYGGLSKPRENLDGISVGAFEMAQTCTFYHPDKVPSYTAMDLPFLGIGSVRQLGAFQSIVQQHPALVSDMAKWNALVVMPSPQGQYNLVGVGDPIGDSPDLSGMRIRIGGPIGDAFGKLGAVPTSLPSNEAYNALSTGVIDAVAFAPHAHLAFKTGEVGNWWTTNINPGAANCPIIMNRDAYYSLTTAQQQLLVDTIPDALEHYYTNYEKAVKKWGDYVDANGITRITFSPGTISEIKSRVASVHDDWLAKHRGSLPADDIYKTVLKAAADTAGQ